MGTPKGMIAAEEFAKAKGYSLDETISLIRSGHYVGHIVGGQWFVKPEDTSSKTQQSRSEPSAAQPTNDTCAIYHTIYSRWLKYFGWDHIVRPVLAC